MVKLLKSYILVCLKIQNAILSRHEWKVYCVVLLNILTLMEKRSKAIVQCGQSKLFPDFEHAKLEQSNNMTKNICKIKQATSFFDFSGISTCDLTNKNVLVIHVHVAF